MYNVGAYCRSMTKRRATLFSCCFGALRIFHTHLMDMACRLCEHKMNMTWWCLPSVPSTKLACARCSRNTDRMNKEMHLNNLTPNGFDIIKILDL